MNILIPREVNELLAELEFGTVELNELAVYSICTDKESGEKLVFRGLVLDSDDNTMLEWIIKDSICNIWIYDEEWKKASLYDLDTDSFDDILEA